MNFGRPLTFSHNFESFCYTRRILSKPSRYGVVTQKDQIISANHNPINHLQSTAPLFGTKNAFVQTVVEAKPRRVVAAGGRK